MNLNDYIKVMDDIHADQEKLIKDIHEEHSPAQSIRRRHTLPHLAAAVLILALLSAVLWSPSIPGQKEGFSITVHAAESESTLLPGEEASIRYTAEPLYKMASSDTEKGCINYDLWLECTGEGIESITYRCLDMPVRKEDLGDVPCYFVLNKTIPADELAQYDYIRSLKPSNEDICHIVQLVGNEYTVPYEAQADQCTGIEFWFTKDGENAIAEPFSIDVLVSLKDGNTQSLKLLLTPMADAFSGLKIELKK